MGKFFTMRYQGGAAAVAAPSITYASSDVTWYDGIAITPLTVTNTGGAVTSYSVSPALPTGVSLNTSTGEISGTPTALDADDTYTITATGPGGSDEFELTAEVLASLFTGLVAYWNLDEASGDRADSHTNGLDLTDNNTVGSGLGVDGSSTAADFEDTNSEYLSHADDSLLQIGDIDLTFAGWFYLESNSGSHRLISKGSGSGTPTLEYRLACDSSKFLLQIWRSDVAALNTVTANTFGSVSTGTWYFVCAWRDTTAGNLYISVNNGTADSTPITVTTIGGTGPFNIGRDSYYKSAYFDGRAQGIGFWKRVLTADERTWLYNSGSAAILYDDIAGLY